jgi:ketosteroid isomerase-like protein
LITIFHLILLSSSFSSQTDPNVTLTAQLRAKDQLLLNAVHSGDRAAWEKNTSSDFIYVEEGGIQNRADFLKGLEPDSQEPLKIRQYELHLSGDTALVVHHDEIPVTDVRAKSNGEYLMTETWQRMGGEWKLRIVHIDAVRTDPPAISLTHTQIDELVGTYHAETLTYTIRRDGDRILAKRSGRSEVELKAETRDVLFLPGDTRARRVFQRDAEGRVTSFARRDENTDTIWTRMDDHR